MFAKFSPDGRRVAFVRANNLFVTDLATHEERALTNDGSDTIINGTSDWVYEEELVDPRRIPLEPGFEEDRVLALRSVADADLPDDRRAVARPRR